MSDVIRLGGEQVKKKWASVGEQLRKIETLPTPLRILASPKTTVVLGTTLAALTGGAGAVAPTLWKGTKILGGVALAEGLIQASPKAEEVVKRKLQPEKVGKYLGTQIEEFGKEKEGADKLTFKEKVKEGLKKAGIIGGAVAGAGAIALGVSKAVPYVKEKLAERKAAKEVGLISKDMPVPSAPLSHPYVQPALAGYPAVSSLEPAGALKQVPPIQNVIQIQLT